MARHRDIGESVRDAHSLPLETAAELGPFGVDRDREMPAVTLVTAVPAGLVLARGYHRAPE